MPTEVEKENIRLQVPTLWSACVVSEGGSVRSAPNGVYLWGLRRATRRGKKKEEERRSRKKRSPPALVRFPPRRGVARKEQERSKEGGKTHESVGMFFGSVARKLPGKVGKRCFLKSCYKQLAVRALFEASGPVPRVARPGL